MLQTNFILTFLNRNITSRYYLYNTDVIIKNNFMQLASCNWPVAYTKLWLAA